MRIPVNGKHIDVGEALTSHVETELAEAIAKYSDRPVEAIVTFSKDAHEFKTDLTVKVSEGLTAKASSRGSEIYGCFDSGVDKVEKQLRRYKRAGLLRKLEVSTLYGKHRWYEGQWDVRELVREVKSLAAKRSGLVHTRDAGL